MRNCYGPPDEHVNLTKPVGSKQLAENELDRIAQEWKRANTAFLKNGTLPNFKTWK